MTIPDRLRTWNRSQRVASALSRHGRTLVMPRSTLYELTAIAFTRYTHQFHPRWRRECTCLELINGLVHQRGDPRHYARNALLGRAAWTCERFGL